MWGKVLLKDVCDVCCLLSWKTMSWENPLRGKNETRNVVIDLNLRREGLQSQHQMTDLWVLSRKQSFWNPKKRRCLLLAGLIWACWVSWWEISTDVEIIKLGQNKSKYHRAVYHHHCRKFSWTSVVTFNTPLLLLLLILSHVCFETLWLGGGVSLSITFGASDLWPCPLGQP